MLYILISFISFQLLIALINFLSRNYLWDITKQDKSEELVSVLIPARNEEHNLPKLLDDLIAQNYKNIEIIVYNDCSTDKTKDIVEEYTRKYSFFKLIDGGEVPDGWYGKTYACWNLGHNASGDFLLFIDADVRLKGNLIKRAIYYAERKNLSLISIFPKQIMISFGEKLIVPIMNIILLSLLALPLVRFRFFPSLSAANGQFMFYRRDVYLKLNPYEIFKKSRVEDIDIAYYFKKQRQKIACLLGDDELTCRMYKNFEQAIAGFSKNVIAFFRNSVLFAFFYIFANIISFIWALLSLGLGISLLILSVQILTLVLIFASSKQNILFNLITQPIRLIILIYIVVKSLIDKRKKGYLWKGRYVK